MSSATTATTSRGSGFGCDYVRYPSSVEQLLTGTEAERHDQLSGAHSGSWVGYLCTNCFAYFDPVGQCQWCNDPMTGDTDHTYVTGCEHCDGYAGHHANE